MAKEGKNRFRFRIDILIEWPKGLFRLVGMAIKGLAIALADLVEQVVFWFKSPWKWL